MGLHRYEGQMLTAILDETVNAWCITQDGQGAIWVGTSHGVYRILDGAMKHFSIGADSLRSHCKAIFADQRNRIWVGAEHGAYLIEDETVEKVNFPLFRPQ